MRDIADIIAYKESGQKLHFIRFMPTLRSHVEPGIIARCAQLNDTDARTGEVICCTLFGKYAMSGANLYGGLAYGKPIADYLNSLPDQRDSLVLFLTKLKVNFTLTEMFNDAEKRQSFCRAFYGTTGIDTYKMSAELHIIMQRHGVGIKQLDGIKEAMNAS